MARAGSKQRKRARRLREQKRNYKKTKRIEDAAIPASTKLEDANHDQEIA